MTTVMQWTMAKPADQSVALGKPADQSVDSEMAICPAGFPSLLAGHFIDQFTGQSIQ